MHQLLTSGGTNNLSNGCDPGKVAEDIVASARKLLTISSEVQVSICEILMRIPVQSAHVRQIVNNKVRALIADL